MNVFCLLDADRVLHHLEEALFVVILCPDPIYIIDYLDN